MEVIVIEHGQSLSYLSVFFALVAWSAGGESIVRTIRVAPVGARWECGSL